MNDWDKGLVPGVYDADSTTDDGNLISAQAIYYPLGTDTDSTFTMDLKSGTVTVTEDGDGYKIITDRFSETGDSVSSYFIGILYDFNTSR